MGAPVILAAQAAAAVVAIGVAFAAGAAGEAVVVARRRRRRSGLAPGNALPREVWERRLSYPAYLATVSRNRGAFDEAYRRPACDEADVALLRRLPPLRVVAIAEDWCPDAFHTLPTWARLVESLPGWELGIYARDTVPDLMEGFVTPGRDRCIPVYAFYLGDALQVWWSGRGASAERALAEFLAGRSFGRLREEERRCCGRMLEEGYRREFRRQSLDEVLALLSAFFHLPPPDRRPLPERPAAGAASSATGAPPDRSGRAPSHHAHP